LQGLPKIAKTDEVTKIRGFAGDDVLPSRNFVSLPTLT